MPAALKANTNKLNEIRNSKWNTLRQALVTSTNETIPIKTRQEKRSG